jgi:hypothetical protein
MSYGINHQVPVKAPSEDVYVVLTETGKLASSRGGRYRTQLKKEAFGASNSETLTGRMREWFAIRGGTPT